MIKELNADQSIYINKIRTDYLRNFVQDALMEFGTTSKLNKANKVADIVWQKFEHLNYINENVQHQFVDITIAGSLLHNLFYVPSDISTILKHRTKLKEIAEKNHLDERLSNLIYEMIEAQLGENHPIQKLKPPANSPSSTLADAIWQVNTYRSRI